MESIQRLSSSLSVLHRTFSTFPIPPSSPSQNQFECIKKVLQKKLIRLAPQLILILKRVWTVLGTACGDFNILPKPYEWNRAHLHRKKIFAKSSLLVSACVCAYTFVLFSTWFKYCFNQLYFSDNQKNNTRD